MNKKNKIQKFAAVFLMICLMCTLLPDRILADNTAREIPEDAIYLSTPEDVVELAENCKVNTWSVGKTVVLKNDIDMSKQEFSGIPTFGGVFIGKGFTIKGIRMKEDGSIIGFFRYLQKTAVVEQVNFEADILPEGTKSIAGAIAGKNAGEIRKCSFKGTVSGKEYIGGLVGRNEVSGLIEDCSIAGVVYGSHFVGGAAGENHGVIRNTVNYAKMNTLSVQNTVSLDEITASSLFYSESTGTTTDIGGIAGKNSGVIRSCKNYGIVGYQHMGYNIGGIAGTQSGYITGCENYAEIQGRKEVGGIVGHMEPNIVLEYEEDSLQTLSNQMDALQSSADRLQSQVENGGNSVQAQIDGLQGDISQVQDALNTFSDSMNVKSGEFDLDRTTAAANDLSSALSSSVDSIYAASQGISSSLNETSSNVSSELNTMVSQMNDVLMTMGNMQSGLGFQMTDVSDQDTEEDTSGKAEYCINYGNISGDINVGGITGMMAKETDLDRSGEILGELSLNADCDVRIVVRHCRNTGTISAGKTSGGGIAGTMTIGAVFDSVNLGNLDCLHADYIGGIAGKSTSYIRNCSSKAVLAGDIYVGGIAGTGKTVTNCYAFVQIAAASEKAGAVLGYTDSLPESGEEEIAGNMFFISGEPYGGIDGISYTGAVDETDLNTFLQIPELDEGFLTVTIRFLGEGQAVTEKNIQTGASFSIKDVPNVLAEGTEEYDWKFVEPVTSKSLGMGEIADITYISEETLSNILFNQTYESSFDAKGSVVSADDRTDENISVLLASGSFAKNTSLEMQDVKKEEPKVNGRSVLVNYKAVLSNTGVKNLHYLLPEGVKGEEIVLLVKDNSGTWREQKAEIDGRYIIFAFGDEDIGFALLENEVAQTVSILWIAGATIAVLLVVVLFFVVRKKRKKDKCS